jgi:spore coat polysaccharide biosynthesis predicted glycosyltransferase SpsG
MKNKKLMKKVIDLDTQTLRTREQSQKVMVQIAIIRQAFGVKNDETNKPVKDYERKIVLSDNEIRKQFNQQLEWLTIAKEKKLDQEQYIKNQIRYFIEGCSFFNIDLANEFNQLFN